MNNVFVVFSALFGISLCAGCGDDTANPFVFDAGAKDATSAGAGKDGSSGDASPDIAKETAPNSESGPETDVDADDSGAEAPPE